MSSLLSGPGVGLQLPQNLYPSELFNAPYDYSNNYQSLAPGDALTIPAGDSWIDPGSVGVLQYQDPVTGIWRGLESSRAQYQLVKSDGFSWRIANLTGCPVAAIVQNGGSGYTQATCQVTAATGNSTWQPIVGGQCSVVSVGSAGSGYGVPPLLLIPAPPNPGVQATGYCVINSTGSVTAVSLTNVGAGYPSAPSAAIVPSPFDPNFSTASGAAVVIGSAGSGAITAVLCTNPGASVSAAPSLTPTGTTGTTATISAVQMLTLTGVSIVTGGTNYSSVSELRTFGGVPTVTPAYTNPAIEPTTYRPRDAEVGLTAVAGTLTTVGTIYDGGLFLGTPSAVVLGETAPSASGATFSLTLGGSATSVLLQPLKC